MNQKGFTLIEVIVALVIVGVGIVALLGALTQGRRTVLLTKQWAQEESLATQLLIENLDAWQQLRTDASRRNALIRVGNHPELGSWEWRAERSHRLDPNVVDIYRISLHWQKRQVETHAILRTLP
jgi:prepilin-type N-terminal cleavage/methylation domain-containing protein